MEETNGKMKARYTVQNFNEIWEHIPEDKKHLFIEAEEQAQRKAQRKLATSTDATSTDGTSTDATSSDGTSSDAENRQLLIDLTLDALRCITKGGAKNARVTCPVCRSHTCDVKRDNGLWHCWKNPDHKGVIYELRSLTHEEGSCIDRQYYAKARHKQQQQGKDKGYVPQAPDDYQEVSPQTLSRLYPIYPYAEGSEEQQQYITHFHPANLLTYHPDATPLLSPAELKNLQSMAQSYVEAMGISPEVIKQERVMCAYISVRTNDEKSEDPHGSEPMPAIAYCNWLQGRLINVKLRSVRKNPLTGEWLKHFDQITPTKPCAPYGIHSIDPLRPNADTIHQLIFTEGEKDRLTLRTCGFSHVLSIANGAATNIEESHEAFEDWINQAEEIIICGDTDKPGRGLVSRLLDRYAARAKVVALPQGKKDISEAYQAFGAEEVRRLINEAQEVDQEEVYELSQHQNEILSSMMGEDDPGYDVGMGRLTDGIFHPTDEGGLIVLTGIPNSGKTDFLNCLMTHLMYHNQKRVAFFSFELPKKSKHVRNIARIAMGVTDTATLDGIATPQEARQQNLIALGYLTQHMVDFDTKSRLPNSEDIIHQAEREKRKHGLDYLVIDPYIFIDMSEGGNRATETEKVRLMLTKLQAWSRAHHVWTIIVAHPRIQYKDGHEDFPPLDIYAIAGSAQWANLADFLLTVRRINKPQEQKVYTIVEMLKVRDQEHCRPGKVYYMRQPCGRYDERESEEQCINDYSHRQPCPQDREPW